MQALKEEWYPETIRDMEAEYLSNKGLDITQVEPALLDDELVKEIDQILAKHDDLFVEKAVINATLEKIKQDILDYKIGDKIVNSFYKIHFTWDRKLSYLARSDEFLKIADIEEWPEEYLIRLVMKTIRVPVSNLQTQLGLRSQDMREVQKASSIISLNPLPYEVVKIRFEPIDKLCLSPFLAIIALVHSEQYILTIFNNQIMIKDGWQHFGVDWDDLRWVRQKFLWKEIIENPNLLWVKFFDETIQEIREALIGLLD